MLEPLFADLAWMLCCKESAKSSSSTDVAQSVRSGSRTDVAESVRSVSFVDVAESAWTLPHTVTILTIASDPADVESEPTTKMGPG